MRSQLITLIAGGVENTMGDLVIARDNKLPVDCPEDMERFKDLTTGGIVIMGRKTYESIGKPLPNRQNMVISSNSNLSVPPGVEVFPSLDAAVAMAELDRKDSGKPIFIIGGGKVYNEAIRNEIPDVLDLSLLSSKVFMPQEGDVVIDTQQMVSLYQRCQLENTDYGYITKWRRRSSYVVPTAD